MVRVWNTGLCEDPGGALQTGQPTLLLAQTHPSRGKRLLCCLREPEARGALYHPISGPQYPDILSLAITSPPSPAPCTSFPPSFLCASTSTCSPGGHALAVSALCRGHDLSALSSCGALSPDLQKITARIYTASPGPQCAYSLSHLVCDFYKDCTVTKREVSIITIIKLCIV